MPEKTRTYDRVLFPGNLVQESFAIFKQLISKKEYDEASFRFAPKWPHESFRFERLEDFLRHKGFDAPIYHFGIRPRDSDFTVYKYNFITSVTVELANLEDIESTLAPFERDYEKCRLTVDEIIRQESRIFLGHGRSKAWRDLKDHLTDKHSLKIEAYETGARAGYTIKEVLEDMVSRSSIAFLVLTGEDIDRDGLTHARENVVHETGLFQGKLGFQRAIVLLEDECQEFSNIAGLQQIRFAKGNIKEVFGEVLAVIRRELGPT